MGFLVRIIFFSVPTCRRLELRLIKTSIDTNDYIGWVKICIKVLLGASTTYL